MSDEGWDLVEELKSWPVDNSPEARELRRIAGGVSQMNPEDIKVRASPEVTRRLEAFDAAWELVIDADTSASANGYGDILDVSIEGEWYAKGAAETLEKVRALLMREPSQ